MMFSTLSHLNKQGIMGINQRNLDFVLRYNPKKYIELADDKVQTKRLAQQANVAVPELYGIIEYQAQVAELENILAPYSEFVIKPAHGSGGKGILIINQKIKHKFRKPSGALLNLEDMHAHISNILSGIYSLGGYADHALIEHRVVPDPIFESICFQGVPDIRVVVLLGHPIMAMARLPTFSSDGKANLHQGAIGVGINIATGITLAGVMRNESIIEHPDTLNSVINIQIPYWEKILTIAANCYELTHLGFIGVDIVIDKVKGPLVLEINARPGLNIQIANRDGLSRRCQLIEKNLDPTLSAEQRIDLVKRLIKNSTS